MILQAPTEVPDDRESIVDKETAAESNANQRRHKIIFRKRRVAACSRSTACAPGCRGDVMDSSRSLGADTRFRALENLRSDISHQLLHRCRARLHPISRWPSSCDFKVRTAGAG